MMIRLQPELDRLYLPEPSASELVDAQGRVRAMVLEVVQPVGWDALSEVWQGVQMELELPAPAIAVSGRDGLQLWFSLEVPLPAGAAHDFLDALRARFLPHVAAARVRLWPSATSPARHCAPVPAPQAGGNWSAFVAPDLAPLFSDTPWLDIEPGDEGQANLLRGLRSIRPAAFDAARAAMWASAPHAPPPAPAPAIAAAPDESDPRRFLQRVMNDERVDMALRVEAAKALLAKG